MFMTGNANNCGLSWDFVLPESLSGTQRWVLSAMQNYGQQLVTMLWRMLGNEQDVCDAYQDTFLKLAHYEGGQKPEYVKAYIFRSASNVAMSMLRHRIIERKSLSEIHAAKDPTRGGLANALNEFSEKSGVGLEIDEEKIPTAEGVRAASEMLGIDPLEVANEGKVIVGVPKRYAEKTLEIMKKNKLGKDAAIIGKVTKENKGRVILNTLIGGKRILEKPLGDPVPRVC